MNDSNKKWKMKKSRDIECFQMWMGTCWVTKTPQSGTGHVGCTFFAFFLLPLFVNWTFLLWSWSFSATFIAQHFEHTFAWLQGIKSRFTVSVLHRMHMSRSLHGFFEGGKSISSSSTSSSLTYAETFPISSSMVVSSTMPLPFESRKTMRSKNSPEDNLFSMRRRPASFIWSSFFCKRM